MSQAFFKLAYHTFYFMEIAYPLWKVIEVMCVLPYTHTHKKKSNQALHENNRELSLALSLSFY